MKKLELRNIIRNSIKELMVEAQGCSPNAIACSGMMGDEPPSNWKTSMENLAASPGGCLKIVQKEMQISYKFQSKIGTTSISNCGPRGTIHRICNGTNPRWAAKLSNKLTWLGQSSSPFMLCAGGTCNDNTNDCS